MDSQATTQHFVTLLQSKSISWKKYQENIDGTTCPLVSAGEYAVKHDPFVYFDDVLNSQDPNYAYCISHVLPFTEMAHLATGNAAQYNFITPNLCDDMRDKSRPIHIPSSRATPGSRQTCPPFSTRLPIRMAVRSLLPGTKPPQVMGLSA